MKSAILFGTAVPSGTCNEPLEIVGFQGKRLPTSIYMLSCSLFISTFEINFDLWLFTVQAVAEKLVGMRVHVLNASPDHHLDMHGGDPSPPASLSGTSARRSRQAGTCPATSHPQFTLTALPAAAGQEFGLLFFFSPARDLPQPPLAASLCPYLLIRLLPRPSFLSFSSFHPQIVLITHHL